MYLACKNPSSSGLQQKQDLLGKEGIGDEYLELARVWFPVQSLDKDKNTTGPDNSMVEMLQTNDKLMSQNTFIPDIVVHAC